MNSSNNILDLSKNVVYDRVFQGQVRHEKYIFENLYPDDLKVYNLISNYYKISTKNIAIGFGSGEILSRILQSFKFKDLHVLEPTYHGAERFCNYHNIEYKPIYYSDFNKIDIEDLPINTNIYIANPNGNNGHSFSKKEIQYIIDNNNLVILDEAYIEYGSESFINKFQSNVIILRTFSKSLGLPGIRCGFCVSTTSNIQKIRSIEMPYCSTSYSGMILENHIDKIPKIVERMKIGKTYIESSFDHIKSDGCYVLLDKKYDNIFKDKFLYSYRGDYIRLALTNKELLEGVWLENLEKH